MVTFPIEAYSIYAVTIGTFGQIGQIVSLSIDPGIQHTILSANNDIDPTYISNMKQNPILRFATTDIKNGLDMIGIGGLVIPASTQPLSLWFSKNDIGGPAAGAVHKQLLVSNALVVPRVLSASDGEPARIEYEIIVIHDGSVNDPIIINDNVALPTITTPGVTQAWTVGPWYINGDLLDGSISDFSFDPGIDVRTVGGAGQVYPRLAQIRGRQPTMSCTTTSARVLADLSIKGVALTGLTRAYLKQMVQGGTRTPDIGAGNEKHIKFDVAEGVISVGSFSIEHGANGGFPVTVKPTNDETNAIVAIDTTAFIDAVA